MDYKLVYVKGASPTIPFIKFKKTETTEHNDTFTIAESPTLTSAIASLALAGFLSEKKDPDERLEEMLSNWAASQAAEQQIDCLDLVNQIEASELDPMSITTFLQYHDKGFLRAEFNFGGIRQIYHAGGDAIQTKE